ncbi:MAG: hypothetical protein ACRC5T_09210, partial [Cetobacterium sp.]
EKLIKNASKFRKYDNVYWDYISEFNFETSDFYTLIENEEKPKKELLISSLVDTFKRNYEILEEEFKGSHQENAQ